MDAAMTLLEQLEQSLELVRARNAGQLHQLGAVISCADPSAAVRPSSEAAARGGLLLLDARRQTPDASPELAPGRRPLAPELYYAGPPLIDESIYVEACERFLPDPVRLAAESKRQQYVVWAALATFQLRFSASAKARRRAKHSAVGA